ncbi:MAG: DUF4190 domain-containing protein [Clostridium sp.]|jgi:hypothetical protein|nr:DUF4190 domain-containing protein [Clostridium sp.]
MKLCPNCGYSNEDFSTVCSSCGSLLNGGSEMTDQFNTTGQFNTYESINMQVRIKTSGYAIASLVLGILSLPFSCCCIGSVTGILAVVFGFIAKSKINSSNGLEKGNGMALAGIILGFMGIAISLIYMAILFFSPDYWEEFVEGLETM